MTPPAPVVIVGAGVAAVATARSLRSHGYDGPVVLLNDEAVLPYDRPPLSKQYLVGSLDADAIGLLRGGELEELDIEVRPRADVAGLDPAARRVLLADGSRQPYTAVVIATGADARRLPHLPDLPGVHYLRTRKDSEDLRASLERGTRVAVLGAGFIGLEVASSARQLGKEVVVLEMAPAPLTRVLGHDLGQVIAGIHAEHGVDIRCSTSVTGLTGTDHVTGVDVTTAEGSETIEADVVVVGVGAVPRTAWLEGSGVQVDNGVVCDAHGRTALPGVYAAGDVSRWVNHRSGSHVRVEQWQAAAEQGDLLGATIAADLGVPNAQASPWESVPYFWSDQFQHKIQFCGTPGTDAVVRQTQRGHVACFQGADGKLSGVLAIDHPAAIARGRRHVAAGMEWPAALEWLGTL